MKRYLVLWLALSHPNAFAQSELFSYSVERVTSLNNRIETVAFSPDGKFLVAGTSDGQLAYRDLSSHSGFRSITTVGSRTVGIMFSTDGSLFVAGSENGDIVVVSAGPNPSVVQSVHLKKKLRCLAIAPANDLFAAAAADIVIVLDLKTGAELYRLTHRTKKPFRSLGFARGGASLVGVSEDGAIQEWDVNSRQLIRSLQDEDKSVHAVAMNTSASLLAISTEISAMSKAALSGGGSGVGMGTSGSQGIGVGSGGRAASGSLARFGTGGFGGAHPTDLYRLNRVKIWDLKDGRIAKTLDGMDGQITALSISVDDRFIGSVRQRIKDSYLDVFDVQRGVVSVSIPIPGSGTAVVFSGDGRWLASGNDHGEVAAYSVTGVQRGNTVDDLRGAKYQITSKDNSPLISPRLEVRLAIMDFDVSLTESDMGKAVADLLRNRISGISNISVVERQQWDRLIREQNIQMSDRIDPLNAVRLGRGFGVQKMIFGRVSRFDTTYTINVRLVDVETGREDGVREVVCQRCGAGDLPGAVALLRTALVEQ